VIARPAQAGIERFSHAMSFRFHWHCWRRDMSNFALIKYRNFDGFLITMQHAGTHWLKYMMSTAIASQLGLPPPRYIHNASSNDFIGHPKHPRQYPQAPRIASSHSIPHALIDSRLVRAVAKFPRYTVLVRDMRAALVSNYEKWKGRYAVSFSEYLRGDMSGAHYSMDIWWCLHFLNRWARVRERFPDDTLILRYERLSDDPATEIERVFSHFGIAISGEHIRAAVRAASKEQMADKLDPEQPVRNIIRDDPRPPNSWFNSDDQRFFDAMISQYLHDDYGYDFSW
jgi:hypothetical protein